ncbi:Sterile alpha motif domain-containing protein 3, partial [Armadillidium vulgare]
MEKKVLLKYNDKGTVVMIENEISLEDMQLLAKQIFDIKEEVELFVYDEDFEEDTMLMNTATIKHKQKIEIRIKSKKQITVCNSACMSGQNLLSSNFKLPSFGVASRSLETGDRLNKHEHSTVLKAIFHETVNVHGVLYPSSFDYNLITKALLEQYPNSYSKAGYEITFEFWKKSITQHFRNVRDRIDVRNLPAIHQEQLRGKKRKRCLEENTETLISKRQALWGLKHYLPERAAGETDETIQEHIEFLKKEKNRLHPDLGKVTASMLATFGDRRKLIIINHNTVVDVLKTYPWLQDEQELVSEYGRISGTLYHENEIEKHFEGILPSLKNMMKGGTVFSSIRNLYNIVLLDQRNEQDNTSFVVLFGFASVMSLLGENLDDLFLKEGSDCNDPTPRIIYSGPTMATSELFEVIVEGLR